MFRNHRLARSYLMGLIAILGLLVSACGGSNNDNGNDDASPNTTSSGITNTTASADVDDINLGGKLVVALEAETNSWLPGVGSFANPGTNIARAVYDPLLARSADGNVYPYLAEAIDSNEDLSEWTITLREGVKFHDGTDLTAEVMKLIFDEYLAAEGSNISNVHQVAEVRVDGPLTYTYVLHDGSAAFPDLLVGVMGWPFSVEACRAAGEACGDRPVGTGPFVFENWTRDSEFRATRNPDYWRSDDAGNQLPYLDEIVFRPIPDEDSRFQSVRSGDAQVGHTLRQTIVRQAMDAADAGEIKADISIGNNSGASIINTLVPPTDDVRIRRAMAFALNQDALIAILGGEGISPAQTQYFSADSPWYSADVAAAWPTNDPEAARVLVEEYKNDPNRSDGKAVGESVGFDYMFPADPSLMAVSQAYQQFWKDVGIEANLVQVDQATNISRAVGTADTDPPYLGDFQVNIWRAGGQDDPYTTLYTQFYDAAAPGNVTNYSSDNVRNQLDTLRSTTDFDTRYNAVENIMMEFAENVPNTWTGSTVTAFYSTSKVHNLVGWTIPGGYQGTGGSSAVTFFTETWIEK